MFNINQNLIRMQALLSTKIALTVATIVATIGFAPDASALLPYTLGQASDYAVLGEGGTSSHHATFAVYQSGTVINGNVGVGPYTDFTHGIDATINGRLDYDNTDTLPSITGTITGGTHQRDMSGAVADATTASALYAALVPTQTFSSWNQNGQTINLNHGMNVVQVTSAVTLKQGFTLNGFADSAVVFQIISVATPGHVVLTLSGTSMQLNGGIQAGNILWSLNGTGGDVSISSGANVQGIFLAPDRNFLVDNANVLGQIIGGGLSMDVSIHSSSTITMPGGQVPDTGSAFALLSLGLAFLAGAKRKFRC